MSNKSIAYYNRMAQPDNLRQKFANVLFKMYGTDDADGSDDADLNNFLTRYLNGEDFDSKKLKSVGFDHWSARNIAAYLERNDPDNKTPLYWE